MPTQAARLKDDHPAEGSGLRQPAAAQPGGHLKTALPRDPHQLVCPAAQDTAAAWHKEVCRLDTIDPQSRATGFLAKADHFPPIGPQHRKADLRRKAADPPRTIGPPGNGESRRRIDLRQEDRFSRVTTSGTLIAKRPGAGSKNAGAS